MKIFKVISTRIVFPVMTVALVTLVAATSASAQFTGNPFDPYQAAYRSSSVPIYTPGGPFSGSFRPVPPGLGVVPGFGGFSPIERDLNALRWGLGPNMGVGAGAGAELGPVAPYYEAYRQYDEEFSRIYRPNTFGPGGSVDEQYYKNRKARDELYFRAMNESDPQTKAEMLRQYRQESERAALGLSRQTKARTGAAADRRGAITTPRESAPSPALGTIETYEDLLQESLAIDFSLSRGSRSILEVPSGRESIEPGSP